MALSTAEAILDVGRDDRSSDDGDFPKSNALEDLSSTSMTGSKSVDKFRTKIEHHQSEEEDNSFRNNREPISPLEWKRRGNDYFGKEDWNRAMHAYDSGLRALTEQKAAIQEQQQSDNISATTSTSAEFDDTQAPIHLEVALRSNMAFVLLKLQNYNRAEEECNQLLLVSPSNSKGKIKLRSAC